VERSHRNPDYRLTFLALLTILGSYSVLQTMVLPALPVMRIELHTTTRWVTWIATAYFLAAAVVTPLAGKLGDQFGRVVVLKVILLVFIVGLVGATVAPNIEALIVFRVLQGAAAAVLPLSLGIIRDSFPREKVAYAIGACSSAFGAGAGIGLAVGGFVVDSLSWRWLFLLTIVPVGVGTILVWRYAVDRSTERAPGSIDVPGALLLALGLLSFLLALTQGNEWGWTSPKILGLFAASLCLLTLWVAVELHVEHPMVDMKLMRYRPVALTNTTAFFASYANFNVFVLVPMLAETPHGFAPELRRVVHYGLGLSAAQTGLLMAPLAVAWLAAGPMSVRLGPRLGGMKWMLAVGLVSMFALCVSIIAFHAHTWELALEIPVMGFVFGTVFASLSTLVTEAAPPTQIGIAVGLNTVMRSIGAQTGAQMGAAILSAFVIGRTQIPSEKAFEIALGVTALSALVGATISIFITPIRLARAKIEYAQGSA
jgi:EmrB/QacA subfamily drug resistance transporter